MIKHAVLHAKSTYACRLCIHSERVYCHDPLVRIIRAVPKGFVLGISGYDIVVEFKGRVWGWEELLEDCSSDMAGTHQWITPCAKLERARITLSTIINRKEGQFSRHQFRSNSAQRGHIISKV